MQASPSWPQLTLPALQAALSGASPMGPSSITGHRFRCDTGDVSAAADLIQGYGGSLVALQGRSTDLGHVLSYVFAFHGASQLQLQLICQEQVVPSLSERFDSAAHLEAALAASLGLCFGS